MRDFTINGGNEWVICPKEWLDVQNIKIYFAPSELSQGGTIFTAIIDFIKSGFSVSDICKEIVPQVLLAVICIRENKGTNRDELFDIVSEKTVVWKYLSKMLIQLQEGNRF